MEKKTKVLVVDDEKSTREGLEMALKGDYEVFLASDAARAIQILDEQHIDVLLTDLRMPGMDGMDLVKKVKVERPDLICFLLTAYGNVETAVEAMKLGAYDFLMKPVNLDHVSISIQRALRSRDVESENVSLREQLNDRFGIESIIGNSPAMRDVFHVIKQVAPTQATVLIQGASGTGKELVANAIHRLSSRATRPFVALHCAALSSTLLESELFGHEKGAFTGAVALRRGRFEVADGGTLFLDEISEIDASVQVKLLRVLEERKFERVGGSATVDTDIRLIAATNRNLKDLVAAGKFREDLFFRLDVVSISLPSLREREGDIPLLCSRFIDEFNKKNERKIKAISSEAVEILEGYSWPGNVRELRNTIEKMAVMARGDRLTPRDIPQNIRDSAQVRSGGETSSTSVGIDRKDSLADAEKKMILSALKEHGENRTKAAVALGISRRTLHRKLREYRGQDPKTGEL